MGKSINKTDAFAYKPEYNNQTGANVPRGTSNEIPNNDPFAFRPEYNTDVKKKVGGTELEVGIIEPGPIQSEFQSKKETATDFLVNDIGQNDFFSKLASQTDQYFSHTTPQRVNQEAAEMTQKEVFRNPNSLMRYTDQRIKDLNEDIANIGRQQAELVEQFQPNPIGAPTLFEKRVTNRKRYDQLAQEAREKEEYKKKLTNNVAEVASDLVLSQMDLGGEVDLRKIGRQVTAIADPEQEAILKMAEKGGKVLPGIKREAINHVGLQAVRSFLARNPNLPNYDEIVKKVNDIENEFDEQNPETTALRVREKLGAQLYKDGGGSFFGFGYSPSKLQEIADRPETGLTPSEKRNFKEVVLPTERRLIGTDIPTSGFTRSFYNAIEKGATNVGKTLGDVSGLRDEADQARDLLAQEVEGSRYRPAGESPSAQAQLTKLIEKEKSGKLSEAEQKQKKELENYTYIRNGWSKFKDGVGDLTGQVAMIALTTKGLGAVGRSLAASGAEGGLLGGLTRSTVGQALSNETVGLFTTSYLNAYDNYKQQAIELMPGEEKAAERNAYATVMSSVEALSERIFRDTKVLDAFSKELAPTIRGISTRFINKEITQQAAREETQKAYASALKNFGKEYLSSTGQESTEEAVVDIAQGVADSVYGGQPFDIVKTGQQALNTFLTTALYSPLVAGMAASGSLRRHRAQNTFLKSSIVDMAANPAQYLQSVEDLQLDGTITQQEANEKIKLIKSANQYLKEIPLARSVSTKVGEGDKAEQVDTDKTFDYPETSSYLLHRLNEGILTEQIDNTTDEVLKSKLQKDLKRSQEIRKGIFEGTIGVTPDLKEVIDDDEKADELGIFSTTQVAPDDLIGTPFEIKKVVDENIDDVQGSTKTVLQDALPEQLTEFMQNIAEQAHDPNSAEQTVETFGENIVKYAKELFPDEKSAGEIEVNSKRINKKKDEIETKRKEELHKSSKIKTVYTSVKENEKSPYDIILPEAKGDKTATLETPIDGVIDRFELSEEEINDLNKIAILKDKIAFKRKIATRRLNEINEEINNRYDKEISELETEQKTETDEGQKQEVISASEKSSEEVGSAKNASKGNESQEGDEVLTDQGVELIAGAPFELIEEDIEKPLEATRAKKVSEALRSFATKIQKADITGAGGASAQSDITRVPREVIAFAINRVADAIDAGEAVVNAIQQGIEYIQEQGHIMEDDSFKNFTSDLIAGKKPTVRVQLTAKEQGENNGDKVTKTKAVSSATESPDELQETIDDYDMTTSGEINRFMSGETWEDVFGEKAEGSQSYETQKLSDMLQDGKNMIAIAQNKWGGDVMLFGKPLFLFIQQMSNDNQVSNKKAVLLATFLGELQEAKMRSPERFDAISQLEKAVFAYYQNFMNVRGKEIVAGRLLRFYRDKYIADVYADRILDKDQVKAKKVIQSAEQKKDIDDQIVQDNAKPITEEEKKAEDKAAKAKTENDTKKQNKKKKMGTAEAAQRADNKLKEIEEKMGKAGKGGIIDRIKESIKKINCK
jgi:hypothetical protein